MHLDKPIKQKLSLGALRKNNKTKPKSPDLTGQMKLRAQSAASARGRTGCHTAASYVPSD
jgi:hypothetical protein